MRAARGLGSMSASSATNGASMSAAYEGTTNERGEPHGEGKRIFASGHVYEGRWQNGRCDGFGKFTYPDGQIFEGEWRDGRRNGQGKLSMPGGEVISGCWVDDSLSGPVRRWLAADEAPPASVSVPPNAQRHVKYDAPPASGPVSGGGGGGSNADVEWLRESHDVIWQLNVELQMENERLVAENRRLRLKLRQLLQSQTNQNQHGGCGCGPNGTQTNNQQAAPKVVEGKLRKKKGNVSTKHTKDDRDAKWLSELLSTLKTGGKDDASSFLDYVDGKKGEAGKFLDFVDGKGGADDDATRRRKIMDELIAKAESELSDNLLGRGWSELKGIGAAGSVEAYARKLFGETTSPLKGSTPSSESDLEDKARKLRSGLDAILGWPEGLRRIGSTTGMSTNQMVDSKELRLDGCGLDDSTGGAVCVLLRECRKLEFVDLTNNRLGDEVGEAIASHLKSHRSVKIDLRGNSFSSRVESSLKSAGGDRVRLREGDKSLEPPLGKVGGDAEAFLAFSQTSGSAAPPPISISDKSDAAAFLSFTGGGGNTGGDSRKLNPTSASDFLEFSPGGTKRSEYRSYSGGGGGSSSAADFLASGGGGGVSESKSRSVSFGASTKPSSGLLGKGATNAGDFLASLGGDQF